MYTGHQDAQWRPFFQAVERRLGEQTFETWFRPLRLQRNVDDRVLRIAAPNDVVRDWITSKYADTLEQSLNESQMGALRIEWASDPKTTATISPGVASVGPIAPAASPQLAPPTEDVFSGSRQPQREIHFSKFRRRLVQSPGSCCRDGYCRFPWKNLQPALPLRRVGRRQDTPDSSCRPRDPRGQSESADCVSIA